MKRIEIVENFGIKIHLWKVKLRDIDEKSKQYSLMKLMLDDFEKLYLDNLKELSKIQKKTRI